MNGWIEKTNGVLVSLTLTFTFSLLFVLIWVDCHSRGVNERSIDDGDDVEERRKCSRLMSHSGVLWVTIFTSYLIGCCCCCYCNRSHQYQLYIIINIIIISVTRIIIIPSAKTRHRRWQHDNACTTKKIIIIIKMIVFSYCGLVLCHSVSYPFVTRLSPPPSWSALPPCSSFVSHFSLVLTSGRKR